MFADFYQRTSGSYARKLKKKVKLNELKNELDYVTWTVNDLKSLMQALEE